MDTPIAGVARRHQHIGDHAIFCVAGLMTQIAEAVGLSGAVHITAVRVSDAYPDFFLFCGWLFFIVLWEQPLRHGLFVQSSDVGGRLVVHRDRFVQIVPGVGPDVGGIRQ